MGRYLLGAALLGAITLSSVGQAAERPRETAAEVAERKALGSLHLRCDGQPDNMSGTESFARLLGAVSLLGLFAPPVESPDPSKRLFAEKGVDACNQLIDGPTKRETNRLRRVPLILARAVHRIEAKDYSGALNDVQLARGEAQGLGLIGNAYFDRSMGLSFDVIEAEARVRMGDAAKAREIGLRNQARMPMSGYTAIAARYFPDANRDVSEQELAFFRSSQKINGAHFATFAGRLEMAGRFAEAAEQREALISVLHGMSTNNRDSGAMAQAAITHALAGNWEPAEKRAGEARQNMEALIAEGKPENDRSTVVEALDFYQILALARNGKVEDARRNFAARSLWTAPSFGAVLAVTDQLRRDAKPDQLFGSLAKSGAELWEERKGQAAARRLELDTNNRTLWSYILPYAAIGDYESHSKTVWKPKSNLISDKPMKDSKFYVTAIFGGAMTQPDALLLHAANQAKVRGAKGLVFVMLPNRPDAALVQFGNPGDAGLPPQLYLDADAVIAEQRQLIPSPAELTARRATRK